MEQNHDEPEQPQPPVVRHDGWSYPAQAAFLETLGATGIVSQACDYAGMSRQAAYALRRRSPIFAAAWDEAIDVARERLADTLLERAFEGSSEYYYRDGELVGEKKVIDGRLGLAILKRLDIKAHTREQQRRRGESKPAPGINFDMAMDALISRDDDKVAEALAILCPPEVDEVDKVDNPPKPGADAHPLDRKDIWWDDIDEEWCTRFPPPEDFDGEESGSWGERDYYRSYSAEEKRLIELVDDREMAEARATANANRDAFFAELGDYVEGQEEPDAEPSPPPSIDGA